MATRAATESMTPASIIPTRGTMRTPLVRTRLMTPRKRAVPARAASVATSIRPMTGSPGARTMASTSPSPADWVVPVVVGSTKRLAVSTCMICPHSAIDAPASRAAAVLGSRESSRTTHWLAVSRPATRSDSGTSAAPTRTLTVVRATSVPMATAQEPRTGPMVRRAGAIAVGWDVRVTTLTPARPPSRCRRS